MQFQLEMTFEFIQKYFIIPQPAAFFYKIPTGKTKQKTQLKANKALSLFQRFLVFIFSVRTFFEI